jgi:ribosomal protein L37AE/L43A
MPEEMNEPEKESYSSRIKVIVECPKCKKPTHFIVTDIDSMCECEKCGYEIWGTINLEVR